MITSVSCTSTARSADCGHWLAVDDRYLILSSGRTMCALCGLSWCCNAAERKALLAAPSGAA